MTSMEFIEKEIKKTEQDYKLANNRRDVDRLMQKLIHLQQIKSKLEAWEVVKELLIKGESISLSVLFRYHREVYNKINKTYEVQK